MRLPKREPPGLGTPTSKTHSAKDMDLRVFALRTLLSTLTAVSFCFLGVPVGLAAPTLSSPEDARSAPICCSYSDPATGITNPCIAVGAECRATVADLCTNDSLICREISGTGTGVCEQAVLNQPQGTSCESMGPRTNCCQPLAKCDGQGNCTRGGAAECPGGSPDPCFDYSCPCTIDPPTCVATRNVIRCPAGVCTCGYTVQAFLPPDQGTALCRTVCADVGSTSSRYEMPGYCVCSATPFQKCPGSAYGKPFNVIGTMPGSCAPGQLDCQVGPWEPATVACGTTVTQTRKITQPQVGGGAACPVLSQTVTGPACGCQDQPQVTCSLDDPNGQGNEYVFCSTGTDQVWDDKFVRPGASQRCSGSVGSAYYSCMMRSLASDLCSKSTGATSNTVSSFSGTGTVSGSYRCAQWPLSNPSDCKKDCVVSGWSAPPASCASGTSYTSNPTISQQPAYGGAACPGAKTEQCPTTQCGNGILETGEQCDTGNGSAAGCTPGCKCVGCKLECGGGGCKTLARVKCDAADPVTGKVKCYRTTAWGPNANYTDPVSGKVTTCAEENCCPDGGTDTTDATRGNGVGVCLSLESACPSNPGRPTDPNSFFYSHSPNVSWAKCLTSEDSCMPGLEPACGNNVLEDAEACDGSIPPGACPAGKNCSCNSCKLEWCGDGVVNNREACDGGANCSAECTVTSGGGGGGGGGGGSGGGYCVVSPTTGTLQNNSCIAPRSPQIGFGSFFYCSCQLCEACFQDPATDNFGCPSGVPRDQHTGEDLSGQAFDNRSCVCSDSCVQSPPGGRCSVSTGGVVTNKCSAGYLPAVKSGSCACVLVGDACPLWKGDNPACKDSTRRYANCPCWTNDPAVGVADCAAAVPQPKCISFDSACPVVPSTDPSCGDKYPSCPCYKIAPSYGSVDCNSLRSPMPLCGQMK